MPKATFVQILDPRESQPVVLKGMQPCFNPLLFQSREGMERSISEDDIQDIRTAWETAPMVDQIRIHRT